jgi:hypothetical protein
MRPKTSITNLETGEVIVREYNDEEMAAFEADLEAKKIENETKLALETKKQEVLEKLGLTADEVAALLA